MPAGATDEMLPPPLVLWAQRKNVILLRIALEDTKDPVIKMEKDKLYFKGNGGTLKTDHEVTMEFLHQINPEESKYVARDRGIEVVLRKAEEGPFWKRLLKENTKCHYLKVDFNKWKDEDDTDDEMENGGPGQGQDFEEMMRQMGGLGNAGKDFGDVDDQEDSDDEESNLSQEQEVEELSRSKEVEA